MADDTERLARIEQRAGEMERSANAAYRSFRNDHDPGVDEAHRRSLAEVSDLRWLLAHCRLLEAERNTAIRLLAEFQSAHDELAAEGAWLAAEGARLNAEVKQQGREEAASDIEECIKALPPGGKRRRAGRAFYAGLVTAAQVARNGKTAPMSRERFDLLTSQAPARGLPAETDQEQQT